MAVLTLCGWVVWERRCSWRIPWDRAVTLAVAFLAVALGLCIPLQDQYLGTWLRGATHHWYVNDYLGQLCMMATVMCLVYAAGCRVVPDNRIDWVMRHIEPSSAATAQLMIVALVMSNKTNSYHGPFPDVSPDGWLAAYWIAYSINLMWLLGYAIRLLWVLRSSYRSRITADLLIMACILGIFWALMEMLQVWRGDVPSAIRWFGTLAAMGFASLAALWSSRSRLMWFYQTPKTQSETGVKDQNS